VVRTAFFILKALSMFLPTFVITYVIGTLLLASAFGLLTGTPELIISRDLAGVPFIYYIFGTALPFGLLGSSLLWLPSVIFAVVRSTPPFVSWLLFELLLGTIAGALSCLPVLAMGLSSFQSRPALAGAYVIAFAATGSICGALISPLWYFACHRALSP
jgi:hypothetical protein